MTTSRPPPRLSVVVVNRNRCMELERCLRTILEHTEYAPMEVIVVDNGSSDGSAPMVRTCFPRVSLIENDRNEGAGRARNQGVMAAEGELLALFDCDTYVVDDVIGRSARYLVERPEIGLLGPELCFPDGSRQYSANRAMSIRHSLFQNLWLYRLLPKSRRAAVLLGGYWDEDREIEVDWLVGASMLLRRELFLASGGFDVRLFPEDSEWCIRLRRAGHRILYAPKVGVVYHTGSVVDEQKLRLYHSGGLEAYATLNGRVLASLYRLAQLFGASVRWTVYRAAAVMRPSEYLAAQTSLYRQLVGIYLRPHA
jgi:GT2 family glycosyltransferase